MENIDVSIIIVNYNTKQFLSDCLHSIYEYTKDITFEVIVSDNGSVDGSIEMIKKDFPQVILIENNANFGFGAANNRGLKIAKGKYIFYLNSDTVLLNNAVKLFFDYFEENAAKENIGALGTILLNYNNEPTHSGGNFPNLNKDLSAMAHNVYGYFKLFLKNIIFKAPIPTPQVENVSITPGNIDYITGADLFLENSENAFFDEDFFMYCEETYLQYQLSKLNKNRIIITAPQIIHYEGKSANKITNDIIRKEKSFSAIQNKISKAIFFHKTNCPAFKIFLFKIFISLLWLNPLLIKTNIKFLHQLWSKNS